MMRKASLRRGFLCPGESSGQFSKLFELPFFAALIYKNSSLTKPFKGQKRNIFFTQFWACRGHYLAPDPYLVKQRFNHQAAPIKTI
jgi:hypothetical protein